MGDGTTDEVREPGRWVLRMAAGRGWDGPLRFVTLTLPIYLALPLAMFGHTSEVLVTQGVTTILGVAGLMAYRDRRLRRALRGLDRATRTRVARTVLTGVPDGDPDVDRAAATILDRPERDGTISRLVAWRVLVAVALLTFVVAAWRSSWWWLAVGAVDVVGLTAVMVPWWVYDRDAARARFASGRDEPAHLDEA